MAPEAPREQEQSIKARKRELFEEKRAAAGPRRRFAEYLVETPAGPLSPPLKFALWALSSLILILFIVTILTMPGPRGRQAPAPKVNVRPPAPAGR